MKKLNISQNELENLHVQLIYLLIDCTIFSNFFEGKDLGSACILQPLLKVRTLTIRLSQCIWNIEF